MGWFKLNTWLALQKPSQLTFSFQLLSEQQCRHFSGFSLLPDLLDGSVVYRLWQTHTEVAEYERLFLRSSAICQRFLRGKQWRLWGLQTDLTASLVVTFHRRFSYKCVQRDLSQRLEFPHISALTLFDLSVSGSQQLSFSNVWGSLLHLAHQSDKQNLCCNSN